MKGFIEAASHTRSLSDDTVGGLSNHFGVALAEIVELPNFPELSSDQHSQVSLQHQLSKFYMRC